MQTKHKPSERGQVLILLVFGVIALLGLTGLAVDGQASNGARPAANAHGEFFCPPIAQANRRYCLPGYLVNQPARKRAYGRDP